MTRVKTTDAREALREIVTEQAKQAAGTNNLISKEEAKSLDPALAQAEQRVRAEGGKGARVTAAQVTESALSAAGQLWDKHNPSGGADGKYLSKAEIQAIAKEDPGLGALSKMAYLRVSQSVGGADAAADVRAYFNGFGFEGDPEVGGHAVHHGLPGATKIDARAIFPENRATLPAGVLASFDFYQRAEDEDWASVTLQKAKISGHDVFVVYLTNDGDEGYLEVLDKKGAPLASARLNADVLIGWDEVFGRLRFADEMARVDEYQKTSGIADPAARAAAGQIPAGWAGSTTVAQGQLHWDTASTRLGAIDLPAVAGKPEHELALAALEFLWSDTLRPHVQSSGGPFLLGAHREGTLALGTFTRAGGQELQVADWRDKNGGGHTLYFDRTSEGRLRLVEDQTNAA